MLTERSNIRLTEYPNRCNVFIEGYNAFMAGEPVGYNLHDGDDYYKWIDGYIQAYEDLKNE